ncbi:MAG: ATP-binding protein [Candidatus Kariarchaeaceae archaeon]
MVQSEKSLIENQIIKIFREISNFNSSTQFLMDHEGKVVAFNTKAHDFLLKKAPWFNQGDLKIEELDKEEERVKLYSESNSLAFFGTISPLDIIEEYNFSIVTESLPIKEDHSIYENYLKIFEIAPLFIAFLSTDYNTLYLNRLAREIINISDENSLRYFFDLIEGVEEDVLDILPITLETGASISLRGVKPLSENQEIHMDLIISPMPLSSIKIGSFLVVGQEVSERYSLETRLSTSLKRYEDLFENALDGLLLCELSDGQITQANKMTREFTNCTEELIVQKKITEIFHEDTMVKFMLSLKEQGWAIDSTIPILKENSSSEVEQRVYDIHASMIYQKSEKDIFQMTIRDTTERIRMENEIRQYTYSLEEMVRNQSSELIRSEKLASLGRLISGIAHEINNPLSFIISNEEVLQEYYKDLEKFSILIDSILENYQELTQEEIISRMKELQHLREEINLAYIIKDFADILASNNNGLLRVQRIVSDLRVFSRDQQPENRTWFRIEDEIEISLRLMQHRISSNIQIYKSFNFLELFYGNNSRLGQVFMNLISNAMEAIPESLDEGMLKIKTEKVEDKVIITVSDNGVGIPEKYHSELFEPFFTTKTQEKDKGMGLGLSICYGIITEHGGTISFESIVGKGTVFTIELPYVSKDEN